MKRKIVLAVASSFIFTAVLLSAVFWHVSKTNTSITEQKTLEMFPDENEYQKYITEKLRLEKVSFSKVKIELGDNFWKIARKFNSNMDSMIALNPHWKSLNASYSQTVLVPSEKGTLLFLSGSVSKKDAAKYFGVCASDVYTEKMSLKRKIHFAFTGKQKFTVFFIRDKKPSLDNMTDDMADQYALREMFRSPLGGRLSSFFGNRMHPIFQRYGFHNGIDIAANYGTPVGASRGGTVTSAGWMGGYGKAVIIEHEDGYKTLYGHLSSINVRTGQTLKAGQFVGRVGSTGYSTGPHLHFTLWQGERLINPLKVLW